MRISRLACALVGLIGACGDDGTSAGRGSQTLLVDAQVDYEDGGASARISVRRAGQSVGDAIVTLRSELGDVALVHEGNGVYRGRQAGWMGLYGIVVRAGANGADHLDGALAAPEPAVLIRPTPDVAFDPHLAERGVIELAWAGDRADRIRVKTKEYDPGYVDDQGSVLVSNTYFIESHQEVSLRRENAVVLAGGTPGSELRARVETKTELNLLNPF